MRRAIESLVFIGLVGAVALTAGCGDDSKPQAADTTTAAPTSAKPAPAVLPGEPVDCGTGPNGLAVIAHTTKGVDFCSHAVAVVDAYAAQREKQPDGDIAVTVDNMRWVCGERQGDPNPYQECASQNESADIVRLAS
ncbi:hypothetical protein [Nocardia sp. NPDC050406]|uniref:hypothetical protein n=1 Tax=Nocardia sp. NPDC050406 TaxID=3364318 RepID=UPI0037B346A2